MNIVTNESTHYSYATDPTAMKAWADYVAFELYKLSKQSKAQPVLYGMGISGISSIISLSQKLETYKNFPYGFALIRKPHESSHSDSGNYEMCLKNIDVNVTALWIFVDDFVDTGLTFKNALSAIQKSKPWKEMELKKIPATLGGRLMYINQKGNPKISLLSVSNLSVYGGEYCGDKSFKMEPIKEKLLAYF